MPRKIETILRDLEFRQRYGSVKFYQPLEDNEERALVIAWYKAALNMPTDDTMIDLVNSAGTKIATGYSRIVIGDYGAYIEIPVERMVLENIQPKWSGEPKRPVKYIWLETKDSLKTKVYLQKARVSYADYRPGFYYIAPADIRKDKPNGDGICLESRRA